VARLEVRIMEVHFATEAPVHSNSPAFWRHFVEMVIAMLVSMAVFGAIASMAFTAFGHSSLLHYVALRGLLMTTYMVVGMALWMHYRHHGWASIGEMSAMMLLPYLVLVGPFAAGLIGKAAFLASMHVLMFPLMLFAMIRRRAEYSGIHGPHR